MYLSRGDEKLELIRLALIHSNDKATINLLTKTTSHRFASLLGLQYLMNHLKNLCNGCSICCQEIDAIGVSMFDVERMAAYLKMPIEEFISRYVKRDKSKRMLLRRTKPCAFLEEGRCSIYPVRPNSCVIYPFLGELQWGFIERKTNAITIPKRCQFGLKAYTLAKDIGKAARQRFSKEELESLTNSLLRKWALDGASR